MNSLLGSIGTLAAALGGFCALGLAMDRHYEDSFGRGREPGRWRPWLQVAGSLGLLLSLLGCWSLRGPAQGTVLWCGVLTAGGVATALMLTYAPRHAVRVLGAAAVGATSLMLVAMA
ncbi:DUF3325 domain-containing protein [Xylophilus sp. GOD-11R]|uniref:DUF3325 domain-containing protein n=1 Tax=Xylophilus sp. GOD-11R TaxID=3089814 RepID=UPI00298CB443|nr:DUF3325 domain-containing protein [Xylophilus sp. GOD-11R]WPB55309.1 DUF3325 domain-containing protein [Xylophilus sp. GOD-11R]